MAVTVTDPKSILARPRLQPRARQAGVRYFPGKSGIVRCQAQVRSWLVGMVRVTRCLFSKNHFNYYPTEEDRRKDIQSGMYAKKVLGHPQRVLGYSLPRERRLSVWT